MEQYEQPGGNVRSKVPSKEYRDNFDTIFREKEKNPDEDHSLEETDNNDSSR